MQGSEDDFREFYFGTYEAFCKYVRKMAGRESVVEDIVQESYCMAYACWDMLEGHQSRRDGCTKRRLMWRAICAGEKKIRRYLWKW